MYTEDWFGRPLAKRPQDLEKHYIEEYNHYIRDNHWLNSSFTMYFNTSLDPQTLHRGIIEEHTVSI
jgi:hypothetical protein